MEEKIGFKELVELFVHTTLRELNGAYEGYKVNFIFDEDAINYFNYVKNNPFTMKNYIIPDINDEDIELASEKEFIGDTYSLEGDNDNLIIEVHRFVEFFDYLVDIVNSNLRLYQIYGEKRSSRNLAMHIMRRIWLRMTPDDVLCVEEFLKRQLDFIESEVMDEYKFETVVDNFCGNEVVAKTDAACTWDETPRVINFKIKNETGDHDLPKIHFGLDESENIAYIYAVQNIEKRKVNKIVERDLYKLNKGINECIVHPSAVCSLITFINMLRSKGIEHIRVPILEILSYDYHIYLANNIEERFNIYWDKDRMWEMKNGTKYRKRYLEEQYEHDKQWYNHVVNKHDVISKNKTEYLIDLIMRVGMHIPDMEITNEVGYQGNYIDIKFKSKEVKKLLKGE